MEISETQSTYLFFYNTLHYFIKYSIYSQIKLVYNDRYSIERELDTLKGYPILEYRRKVIDDFFYSKNGILKKEDLSIIAFNQKEKLLQAQRTKEKAELENHLENRNLIAGVGDYCVFTKNILQPLNLMEILYIGNTKDNTYIGLEVDVDLKTGKIQKECNNEKIACVITKEFLANWSANTLRKIKTKKALILHLKKLEDQNTVKYYSEFYFKLGKVK